MKTPRLFCGLLALALVSLPLLAALAQADYSIATDSGNKTISIVNNGGLPDNLVVSFDSGSNGITFAVQNRSFQVNNAPTTQNSATVPLSGVNTITISCGANGQFISIGAFSGFPSLIINGSSGSDTVTFTGNITFAAGNRLSVNLQTGSGNAGGVDNIYVSGAQLKTSGFGTIDLECSQRIYISNGALVQAVSNVILMANQQTPATSGNFSGVTVDGSGTVVQTTGGGVFTIMGTGGDDSGGFQAGVSVTGGAQLLSTNVGNITGTGGAGTGIENRGVLVYGAGSTISGSTGVVKVVGVGGAKGSGYGTGVSVLNGGLISSTDNTEVDGTGNGGGDFNYGVEVGGAVSNGTPASAITSTAPGPSDGSSRSTVLVTAIAGPGNSLGLILSDAAELNGFGDFITTDSLSIFDTASIIGTSAKLGIAITTLSATTLDLGGNNAAGTLGLVPAVIARLQASSFFFANQSGTVVISQPITLAGASVYLGAKPGVKATAKGTDFDLAQGTLNLAVGSLSMPITGTVADTGYPQLHVKGSVSLAPLTDTPVTLDLTGSTYAGKAGDTFTIVKVDGGQVVGTFSGYPEGFTFPWPANSALNAQITYVGGSGHDVVLTLANSSSPPSPTPTLTPTSTPTGSVSPTPTATPTATPTLTPGTLGNISTRLSVGTGNNVLIGGFIITGSQSKQVLVRATGPSLSKQGVTGFLADPMLTLFDASSNLIGSNDNWQSAPNASQIPSNLQPGDPAESAILITLNPGNYTAIVSGVGGTTGIALVEAYDLQQTPNSKLANISTRGFVQTGDNVMIGGVIIQGSAPAKVIVRGRGPSLTGVPNPLLDPQLSIVNSNGMIVASNDNWQTDAGAAEMMKDNLAPGDPREAATLQTLAPGNYTALAQGVGQTTGIGLVEVYNVQ